MILQFTVYGVPIPKGSTKAFVPKGWKRPIVTADNKESKPWQQAVVDACRELVDGVPPLEGAVTLVVRFFMPRPKSAPKRVTEPTKKPDLDKLLRCIKDGLTRAGVYHDDGQVTVAIVRKDYAAGVADPSGPAGVPRAWIHVSAGAARDLAAWSSTAAAAGVQLELTETVG